MYEVLQFSTVLSSITDISRVLILHVGRHGPIFHEPEWDAMIDDVVYLIGMI